MEKSLLVVGGTGVISFAVVQEAVRQGYKVTCINRGKTRSQTLSTDIEIIKADYHDRNFIETQLKGRHFGAVLDVLCFKKENIDYSLSLFKDHCEQYLFFSSAEAYNKKKYEDAYYDETAELGNSLWSYGRDKEACEKELIRLAQKYKITYTIIRPAITYGNTRIPYGVMPPYGYHGTIIKRIENKKPVILWDGGQGLATIMRVEDFAIGFVGLLGNQKAFNQAFNICGDEVHKWKDVIDDLGSILGVEPIYIDIPSQFLAEEMPHLKGQIIGGRAVSQKLSNAKLKEAVPNFKTNIGLQEGIRLTVDYYRRNNYLSGIDWSFDADWDRIINKWCKKRHIDASGLKLSFVDYLGNATRKDKFSYFLALHKDNLFIKLCSKAKYVMDRCARKIKRLIIKNH